MWSIIAGYLRALDSPNVRSITVAGLLNKDDPLLPVLMLAMMTMMTTAMTAV